MPGVDLFCRVVDNLGDIGVCWRLARQLAASSEVAQVRLWVDDLASFQRIQQDVRTDLSSQDLHSVRIEHWSTARRSYPAPHALLIEAFGCELPEAVKAQISPQEHVWINLEYLSAEPWVTGCHGLPSPQANRAAKYFFFPGFLPGTGGLLREPDLLARRDAFLADDAAYEALLQRLGVRQDFRRALMTGQMRQVFLFCYPDAPVLALSDALAQQPYDTLLLVPDSVARRLPSLAAGRLQVQEIPHVDQADFDALLWRSTLNIVRGEDSLVRAIWAGAPMIWQPYMQEDKAHLDKLDAWLDTTALPDPVHALHHAWSLCDRPLAARLLAEQLQAPALTAWRQQAGAYSTKLGLRADLAASLLTFYTQVARKR